MAKRIKEEQPEWVKSNIGLMLFTALMIILLAFFIMLSSMAVIDEKRQIDALGSLIGAFGILPGGLDMTSGDGKNLAPSDIPLDMIQDDMQNIRDILANRIMQGKVRILKSKNRKVISFDSALLFPPDGVDLLPDMEKALFEVCEYIRGQNYPVVIQGHTDDQPPQTEEFRDNWQVSSLRAINVLQFMTGPGRIDPARLTAYGYGGYSPLAPNTSPRNREKNNRIDLVLDFSQRTVVKDTLADRRQNKKYDFKGFIFDLFKGKDKATQ